MTDYLAFRQWRERTDFPTPALAEHAELVENDLRILTKLDPVVNKGTVALCKDNITAFAKAWEAERRPEMFCFLIGALVGLAVFFLAALMSGAPWPAGPHKQ